jgi:CheY-like chemotaxis protein
VKFSWNGAAISPFAFFEIFNRRVYSWQLPRKARDISCIPGFFYLTTEVSSLWSSFFIMKRILLVDDHENARIAMKLFLEHLGYVCHEAEQGAAALAWLEQGQNVDLIISDNYMPVMTGLDFLLQVKARAPFHSIPFILYSGNITDEIKQKAHQAGVEAVLSKPYNFANFVAIVNKALE